MDRLRKHTPYIAIYFCFLFLANVLPVFAANKPSESNDKLTTTYEFKSSKQIDEKEQVRRMDTTFRKPQLTTPLLFAHRSGVLEAPESTKCAFRYAMKKAKADVLELDVQLTRDGRYVVWHGPKLDKVEFHKIKKNFKK